MSRNAEVYRLSKRILSQGYSPVQLERLYRKLFESVTRYDGYQPFGYDWRTLWITRPGAWIALRAVLRATQYTGGMSNA